MHTRRMVPLEGLEFKARHSGARTGRRRSRPRARPSAPWRAAPQSGPRRRSPPAPARAHRASGPRWPAPARACMHAVKIKKLCVPPAHCAAARRHAPCRLRGTCTAEHARKRALRGACSLRRCPYSSCMSVCHMLLPAACLALASSRAAAAYRSGACGLQAHERPNLEGSEGGERHGAGRGVELQGLRRMRQPLLLHQAVVGVRACAQGTALFFPLFLFPAVLRTTVLGSPW